MKLFDLEGRVAIVTGGNAGIGLGLAEGLAQAGAKVMICGRRAEANSAAVARLKATGAEIASIEVDVTSHDDLHRLFNMTRKALGPVDPSGVAARVIPARGLAGRNEHQLKPGRELLPVGV
jgi:2-deoxy-D-gluconate 3-dehydrogenase